MLVYVYNGTDEPNLYFYNPVTNLATVYVPETTVVTVGRVLVPAQVPANVSIPRGFSEGTLNTETMHLEGYVNSDNNFIAYMRDDSGNSSFYYYDPETSVFYEFKSVDRTAENVYRSLFYLFITVSTLQSVFIVIMTYAIRKIVNNRTNPRPKRV